LSSPHTSFGSGSFPRSEIARVVRGFDASLDTVSVVDSETVVVSDRSERHVVDVDTSDDDEGGRLACPLSSESKSVIVDATDDSDMDP
jgi:hypothetical protein